MRLPPLPVEVVTGVIAETRMFGPCWLTLIALLATFPQESPQPASSKPSSTSQPAPLPTTRSSATPRDAEILKELIRETDRPPLQPPVGAPVKARSDSGRAGDSRGSRPDEPLGVSDRSVVDRTGRLVRVGDKWEIRFASEKPGVIESMAFSPNEWLELIEREAEQGVTQTIVTGEVSKYRGRYYLMVRSYRRAPDRGNLAP